MRETPVKLSCAFADGIVVWHKDLGSDEYSAIQTDPSDLRRIILNTPDGVFSSLMIKAFSDERVTFKRFQAEISHGGSLQCWMPNVQDIVILLLQRELIFFDLNYGVSLGSVRLPNSKPNFARLIGGFGHKTGGKHLYMRGLDVLLCYHVDGSVSTWKRDEKDLKYTMISFYELLNTKCLNLSGVSSDIAARMPFEFLIATAGPRHVNVDDALVDVHKRPWFPSQIQIIGLPSNGSLWKWELNASSEIPILKSLHEGASGNVCSIDVSLEQDHNSQLIAVGTEDGSVCVYTVLKGTGSSLVLSMKKKFASNFGSAVCGVKWLGRTGRLVMYASSEESISTTDKSIFHKNIVSVVDTLNGQVKVMKQASEAGKIIGMRVSPSGAYVLLLSSGIPSEIWSALVSDGPTRLRQIELDFTSVEWLPPGFGIGAQDTPNRSLPPDLMHASHSQGFESLDMLPEEMLSFSLSDARLGILLVKGRKIQDTRPMMPTWAPLVNGEFQVKSAAAARNFVFFGGNDGTLARWDTRSGETVAVETGCTKIVCIRVMDCGDDGIRLALLSASRTFAVLSMTDGGKFKSSRVTWVSGYSRVGYVTDLAWIWSSDRDGKLVPMLVLQLAEGGICLMSFSRSLPKIELNNAFTPYPCCLTLPVALRSVLLAMIQGGLSLQTMHQAILPWDNDDFDSSIEDILWKYLPHACLQNVLESKSRKQSFDGEGLEAISASDHIGDDLPKGSLAELLKSRVHLEDDSNSASPLYPRNSRNSTDKAAYQLGYRSSAQSGTIGEVTETLKSIRGSVKDIAVAGKEKVQKTLGQKEISSPPHSLNQHLVVQSPLSSKNHASLHGRMHVSLNGLTDVIAIASEMQGLSSIPLSNLEQSFMSFYENNDVGSKVAYRMALAARMQWNDEEEQFWMDVHDHLEGSVPNEIPLDGTSTVTSSLVWSTHTAVNLLAELSRWHSKIASSELQESETLVESSVIEHICLGDIEAAVSILLASPPGISKRFYRDALCSLGMAYACATERLQIPGNELATSLFVQAARVIAINAATAGDSLVSVPLLYSTSKYSQVVDILQQNQMWLCSASLAATKLSEVEMREPIVKLAQHLAKRQGMVWKALGILIGSRQYSEAIDMMMECRMVDRAAALVDILQEYPSTTAIPDETKQRVSEAFAHAINSHLDTMFHFS
jgi:hypothetical protein